MNRNGNEAAVHIDELARKKREEEEKRREENKRIHTKPHIVKN